MEADFQKKWAEIINKAAHDQVFKQRLLSNPVSVLKEYGIALEPGVTVEVVENTPRKHYLVLPESGAAKDLNEEEIRKISGGRGHPGTSHGSCGDRDGTGQGIWYAS